MIPEKMQEPVLHSTQQSASRAKITIIGGGSPYGAYLLLGMLKRAGHLKGCHITLMDIEEEKLQTIYTLGKKIFQQAEVDLTLSYTNSEEEAISDASFIITAFRTGGLQARHLDETLPLRHGIIGHETIGPGGFFAALRTIPVATGIAAIIEKLAPRAFLLNYINPNSIITEAISQANGIRVIGIRNDPPQYLEDMVTMARLPAAKRLYTRTIGLSHGNWTTALWSDGIDILPNIVTWSRDYMKHQPQMTAENYIPLMQTTLTSLYGALPSHHMPYYYFPEQVLDYIRQQPESQAEALLTRRATLLKQLEQEAQKERPHLVNIEHYENYDDSALDVLCAILHDTGDEIVLNVPNHGALKFLAEERVAEIPCRVDARGATPLTQGEGGLALDQRGLIIQLAEYAGASARAALWGTRIDAIKALTANPLILSYSRAEALYNELANAHAAHLSDRLLR